MATPPTGSIPTYADDQPITGIPADAFGRWPFAQRIAHTIRAREDPSSLVVGLYGPWGDGKTSVLNLMSLALKKEPDVVVVRFNPWRYVTEEDSIYAFFDTISTALGENLKGKKAKVAKLVADYAGFVAPVAALAIPGGAQGALAAQDAAKRVSVGELDAHRAKLEARLKDTGKRVVVLIDDVDRLENTEIHALFRVLKLSADFPRTIYVLAFDYNVVATALGQRYGSGDKTSGERFLEKIVQVPLCLPAPRHVRPAQIDPKGH